MNEVRAGWDADRSGARIPLIAGALAFFLASAALPEASGAQARVLTPCRTGCAMEMTELVRLGEQAGEGFVGRPSAVVQRSDERWVLLDQSDRTRLKVFDVGGGFERYVGREGRGPGEFGIALHLLKLSGDSILVYDLGLRRLTLFDPEMEPVQTARVPLVIRDWTTAEDGSVLANGISNAEDDRYPLFHEISSAAGVERSFGEARPRDSLSYDLTLRNLVSIASGRFWAAEMTRYRLTEWSRDGAQLRSLERDVDWFEPHGDFGPNGPERPPSPGLLDLSVDADGLLWVLALVPDPEWRTAFAPGEDLYGRESMVVDDYDRLYDTIVEVIDPTAGRVVSSQRFDPRLRGFAGAGLAYSESAYDNLQPYVQLWRLRRAPRPPG